jgi:hypothetical protein
LEQKNNECGQWMSKAQKIRNEEENENQMNL